MNQMKKKMQAPEMTVITFESADVIATSIQLLLHGYNTEVQNYGLGGFATSGDWYRNHQD